MTKRRGGGGAVVTDYADVVKYKQLVDESQGQVESLTSQLREREKDVRQLNEDSRSRERLNIRLQNENEMIRAETNALTTNRDRVQRELRRQVRLSQSLKQQVKQLEETMRGLERRVESQRRELKLNEQTMELMDQSRKLAEDQAYEAQRRTRHIEKEVLKSPLRNGRRSALGSSITSSNSMSEYTRISRISPNKKRNAVDPRTGLPRIRGSRSTRSSYDRSGEIRKKVGGYDIHGRKIKNIDPMVDGLKPTFEFNPNDVGGWNEGATYRPGAQSVPRQPPSKRTPGGNTPSQRQK